MNILVIDIGGTHVKLWKTGEADKEKFASGKKLTPQKMIDEVKRLAKGWDFDRVSIGYPGEIRNGHPVAEPWNLGDGWVGFDFAGAFGCPTRIMNDACMQALGSYEGGKMLYIGLGTGIGTAFISDGVIVPLSLGHLKLIGGETFDALLGRKGLRLHGKKRWRAAAFEAVELLKPVFYADYVVIGGGNSDELPTLPEGSRRGGNHNAYFGGLRMWDDAAELPATVLSVIPKSAPAEAS